MLDNDMIRLDQKINTIIEIQNQQADLYKQAQKKRDASQDVYGNEKSKKIKDLGNDK